MKKVLSALAKLIPYIPLIIFLMTIFYGLLHIDFIGQFGSRGSIPTERR